MNTDELISTLSAQAGPPSLRQGRAWLLALVGSMVLAAIVFFATIGPRPDFEVALGSVRFLFKFVVTLSLAATALLILDRLVRPGEDGWRRLAWLLLPAGLMAGAVVAELWLRPAEQWQMLQQGKNSLVCLTYIPLIGLGPLGLFIVALRHGAPTRPGLAGAVAGLVAGGVAAAFYAAHCTDDSPLFVATWYTLAIGLLTVGGAVAGKLAARW